MAGTLIETFTQQVDEHAHSLTHTREILAPNHTREQHTPQLIHDENALINTPQPIERAISFEPSRDFRR